jgi:hypothetical protein
MNGMDHAPSLSYFIYGFYRARAALIWSGGFTPQGWIGE